MASRYHSKIDWWLLLILGSVVVVSPIEGAAALRAAHWSSWWQALPVLLICAVLPCWIVSGTYYDLTAESLVVRCGPFRRTVAIGSIADVSPSRNPLASPALSLERLKVTCVNGSSVLISPRDRDGFLRELERLRGQVRRPEDAARGRRE